MRLGLIILVSILALGRPAAADLVVVQEQEQQHPGGISKLKTVIKIKGDKVRIDNFLGDMPMSSSITDHATGKNVSLIHQNKLYQIGSLSEQKESLEQVMSGLHDQNKIPSKRPILKSTGEHQTINGWKTEKYIASIGDSTMAYWIANELLRYNAAVIKATRNPMFAEMEKQFPDPSLFPGMPVLTILEQKHGGMQIKTTIRTVSVTEGNIPDTEFAIPQDYKKQQ